MSNVLDRIVADKREHVARRKQLRALKAVEADARRQTDPRGFFAKLKAARTEGRTGLIAEIKKASPSKGLIREDFNPPALARAYEKGGASCLSILTDTPYFQGQDADLTAARDAVKLPCLRKDFMIDPYQIVDARAIGADCVLLIMACLEDDLARDLARVARDWGMDVLVEVHDEPELDRALTLDIGLVGINNRNLKTLAVDLATTERLAPKVSADRLVVCESGIETAAHVARMKAAGVSTFLVGESLMRQPDVTEAVRKLLEPARA